MVGLFVLEKALITQTVEFQDQAMMTEILLNILNLISVMMEMVREWFLMVQVATEYWPLRVTSI